MKALQSATVKLVLKDNIARAQLRQYLVSRVPTIIRLQIEGKATQLRPTVVPAAG